MSNEKEILEGVEETEDSYLEVYLRFNDDMEKDYCFQIKSSATFRLLFKIFNTIPIALRPNLFYSSQPTGFSICRSPGYLTEDGSILFDYETAQFTEPVKDLDERVSSQVWPGQLILPNWEFNYFAFYSFLSALLVWLYTDLPDFISPTPGICLTNKVSVMMARLCLYFEQPRLADALLSDINEPVSIMAQCIFFFFHVVKCLVIFLIIHTGAFNPIKLFRFGARSVKLDVTKEELLAVGWTGSKKATPDDYKEFYRDYKIKQYGSMINAHQAGLFDKLRNLGVFLGRGEGFNTPIQSGGKDAKDTKLAVVDGKLPLSYSYLEAVGDALVKHIRNKEGGALLECVKNYRRYGLLDADEKVAALVQERKTFGNSKI